MQPACQHTSLRGIAKQWHDGITVLRLQKALACSWEELFGEVTWRQTSVHNITPPPDSLCLAAGAFCLDPPSQSCLPPARVPHYWTATRCTFQSPFTVFFEQTTLNRMNQIHSSILILTGNIDACPVRLLWNARGLFREPGRAGISAVVRGSRHGRDPGGLRRLP